MRSLLLPAQMRWRPIWTLGCLLCLLSLNTQPSFGQGLTVGRDGLLKHDGKSFRGIGVDYFDAFYRVVREPATTSYEAGFQELSRRHIPFCRILCGGFWPSEQSLFTRNPALFFAGLDRVVRCAEKNRVGLILTLFWTPSTTPDLVGEPVSAWGDTTSKTHAYMKEYVKEIVSRYRKSPAIWGWEFGNEYSLGADLPNASEQLPPIAISLGTPAARTEKDEWHYFDLHIAYAAFAREIRKYDRSRIIETGDSVLRESAWHNQTEKSWKADSPDQQEQILASVNPGPVSVVSMHTYGKDGARIPAYTAWCRKVHKPLFVGEFGADSKEPNTHETFEALLRQVEQMDQPFAAVWVYDFDGQADSWNVTGHGPRSWQLDAIEQANRRLLK